MQLIFTQFYTELKWYQQEMQLSVIVYNWLFSQYTNY